MSKIDKKITWEKVRAAWWFWLIFGLIIPNIPTWYSLVEKLIHADIVIIPNLIMVQRSRLSMSTITFENNGFVNKPINLFMHITLTNNSSNPLRIIGYDLDVYSQNKLIRLNKINFVAPSIAIWQSTDTSKPSYIDFSKYAFDEKAINSMIEPNHSIEGWVFYSFENTELSHQGWGDYIFTFYDANGRSSKIKIPHYPFDKSKSLFDSKNTAFTLLPKNYVPPWVLH
ncbi:MAG: hypothetical protein ACHQQQ_14025 [Bacteroidota bacterium]